MGSEMCIRDRYYISGVYDIIQHPNVRFNYHPFVTWFTEDCDLPGATPIEEYLGLSNKETRKNIYNISFHPNPATNEIRLSTATDLPGRECKVTVYDMTGRALIEHKWHSGEHHVEIGHLQSGVYVCTVSTAEGVVVYAGSFMKQ